MLAEGTSGLDARGANPSERPSRAHGSVTGLITWTDHDEPTDRFDGRRSVHRPGLGRVSSEGVPELRYRPLGPQPPQRRCTRQQQARTGPRDRRVQRRRGLCRTAARPRSNGCLARRRQLPRAQTPVTLKKAWMLGTSPQNAPDEPTDAGISTHLAHGDPMAPGDARNRRRETRNRWDRPQRPHPGTPAELVSYWPPFWT